MLAALIAYSYNIMISLQVLSPVSDITTLN